MIGLGANKMLIPKAIGEKLKLDILSVWELDETSGVIAYDEVGNYDGVNNGALINQIGRVNKCYYFDGIDNYINLGNVSLNSVTEVSWSFWLKRNVFTRYGGIFSKYDFDNKRCWAILQRATDSSQIRILLSSDGIAYDIIDFITSITNNVWIHIVITFNNGYLVFFENGEEIGNSVTTIQSINNINTDAFIGRYGTNYTNGSIDQVGIWNRILTADEISTLYNLGEGLPYSNW